MSVTQRVGGRSLRSIILTASLTALAALIGIALLIGVIFWADQDLAARLVRTDQIQQQNGAVLESVLDLETGLRGYLLTGDPEFREPYDRARGVINEEISRLRSLVVDDPAQVARVNRIDSLINDWQTAFARPVLQRRDAGQDALTEVRTGAGKQRIDRIRAESREIERVAADNQVRIQAEAATLRDRIAAIVVGIVFLSFAGSLFLALILTRTIVRPIAELTTAAARISGGRLVGEVPERGGAEIARLARTFNEMSRAVEEREVELRAQNEELQAQQLQLEAQHEQLESKQDELLQAVADLGTREQLLQRLNEFNRLLAETIDLTSLAPGVLEQIARLAGAQVGALYLADAEGGPPRALATLGLVREAADSLPPVRPGEGVAGRAIDAQRPITGSTPEAALRLTIFGRPVPPDHELAIPLVASGIALGAVLLGRARRAFDDPEIDTLSRLGRQAAIALRNALSHQSLQVAHDTMRRQAEALQAANREAEAERATAARERDTARAVIGSVREAILLTDAAGRVALVNENFAAFVQRPIEDLVGLPAAAVWVDLSASLGEADPLATFLDSITANPESMVAGSLHQAGSTPREWQAYSLPLPGEAGQSGRLFVFRDITREAEVDRMKTEFVSLVSHELRTPLTSIKGYVELLLDLEVGDLNDDQVEFLGIVRSNSDRLVALINDLLDISRMEAGRIELHRQPLDLAEVVDEAVTALQMTIIEKDQRLSIDFPIDLPPVNADPDRLTQILTNLVSNAHKYTPAGGRIGVTARAGDDEVTVSVSDTGIGLGPADRDRLFTKFFRVQDPASEGVGGTGLGLAITKGMVEMHGGRIWVDSAPGEGSTFRFTLPIAGTAAPSAGAGSGSAQHGRMPLAPTALPAHRADAGSARAAASGLDEPARVLVVDDDPDVAGLLRRYLERAGYQVTVAHRGEDALTLARRERFDLITLDVLMPDTHGLAVLERLRAQAVTSLTPVLMVSVLPPQNGSLELQPVDHMTKPVDEATLVRHVARAIRGRPGRQVLVVDDEVDLRRLFVQFLRQAGYVAIEAADGLEALEIVRAQPPSIILLDVRMPRLDGIETLRALRADPATRSIPVIMMTASLGVIEESRDELIRLGISDLLDKPTTPEDIVAFLDRELGRSRAVL